MSASDAELLLAARMGGGLRQAHFQVADRCNHTCVHCYQVQGQKGELTTHQAKAVLDSLARAGVFLLTISGGEATLRDDLLELIAHARGHGMAVTLYTNAFTITPRLAGRLAELAVWRVHVSVYAADPVTHDAVTSVPGSFERTIAGVRHLRAAGVQVILKTPLMRGNADRVDAIRALGAAMGCSVGVSEEMSAREDGSLDPVALSMTADQQAEWRAREHDVPSFTRETIERARGGRTCAIGQYGLAIEPNGEARPCTALVVALGNVVLQDPREAFEGETATFLRSLRVATLHGCRDCDLIAGCQRCHGTAAHEAGDAFGPYASACARALANYRAWLGREPTVHPAVPPDSTRDAGLGPFRIEDDGALRQVADLVTDDDEAIAARYPWVRPAANYTQRMVRAPVGLVQIRTRRTGAHRSDEVS